MPVRIKDVASSGIGNAMRYSYDILAKKLKRRQLLRSELEKQMSLLTGTLDYSGFHRVDMVVEAVFEDLSLKHQMVKDVERECGEHTVFASNTSSLPIHQIASAAAHPERVVGLHYFSPVDKMPLAEIIPHAGTSAETVATTLAFARAQGKTPIVVKDEAGFYVNRILAPYMNEAARLVLEGSRWRCWTAPCSISASRWAPSPCWTRWGSTWVPRSPRSSKKSWGRAVPGPGSF